MVRLVAIGVTRAGGRSRRVGVTGLIAVGIAGAGRRAGRVGMVRLDAVGIAGAGRVGVVRVIPIAVGTAGAGTRRIARPTFGLTAVRGSRLARSGVRRAERGRVPLHLAAAVSTAVAAA